MASRKARLDMKVLDIREQFCDLMFCLLVGPVLLLVGFYWLLVEPILDLLEKIEPDRPDGWLNWW